MLFLCLLFKQVYNKYSNNRTSHQTLILMMNLVNDLIFALVFEFILTLHICSELRSNISNFSSLSNKD